MCNQGSGQTIKHKNRVKVTGMQRQQDPMHLLVRVVSYNMKVHCQWWLLNCASVRKLLTDLSVHCRCLKIPSTTIIVVKKLAQTQYILLFKDFKYAAHHVCLDTLTKKNVSHVDDCTCISWIANMPKLMAAQMQHKLNYDDINATICSIKTILFTPRNKM